MVNKEQQIQDDIEFLQRKINRINREIGCLERELVFNAKEKQRLTDDLQVLAAELDELRENA